MDGPEHLPCQRSLFAIPADVSYLDAAAWSPLPHGVRRAGETGLDAKSRPWAIDRAAFAAETDRARAIAGSIIGATADDIAIVGSVSHAMATASANLSPPCGSRILRVADEFPSLCLPFDRLAAERGLSIEEVPRPPDGDWTAALLEAIDRPGAAPLGIATLTPLHWTDGAAIDLDRITPKVRAAGSALVIDGTQAVGVMPIDVSRWQPDFLAFPTYKWLLGPYGLAFLYVAPARQDGRPFDLHGGNRPDARGARRYDRGELNDPVVVSMAAAGLDLIAQWGPTAIAARLSDVTERLAQGCASRGLAVPPRDLRAGHVLGVRYPSGLPSGVIEALKARNVFASERSGALRLSPHVWADEDDIARCIAALAALLPRKAAAAGFRPGKFS